MARMTEDPITLPYGKNGDETVTTHPAFVQVQVGRVSGHAVLYGSDFPHHHFISLSVHRSKLHRVHSNDRYHAELTDMVEVAMTESQWATLVSSLNNGSGVPATLTRLDGQPVPGLPAVVNRVDQHMDEVTKRMQDGLAALEELRNKIVHMNTSARAREDALRSLNAACREFKSNLGFVADQMRERMEEVVEEAKQEIHGYAVAQSLPDPMAPDRQIAAPRVRTRPAEPYTGAGDLDADTPNHIDHSKRGFTPK